MLIEINKGDSAEDIEEKLAQLDKFMTENRKYPSLESYFGSITLSEDPIEYQRRVRNEWS